MTGICTTQRQIEIREANAVATAVKSIGTAAQSVISQVNNLKSALNSLPNIHRTITYTVNLPSLPSGSLSTSAIATGIKPMTTSFTPTTATAFPTTTIAAAPIAARQPIHVRVEITNNVPVKLNERTIAEAVNRKIVDLEAGKF